MKFRFIIPLLFKTKTRSVNIVSNIKKKNAIGTIESMASETCVWVRLVELHGVFIFIFSLSSFVTHIYIKRTNDRAAGVFLAGNLYLFSVLSKRAREVDEIKTYRLAAKLNNGESWLEQTSPYPKRRTKVSSE